MSPRRLPAAGIAASIVLAVAAPAHAQNANDPDLYRPAPRPSAPDRQASDRLNDALRTPGGRSAPLRVTPEQLAGGLVVESPAAQGGSSATGPGRPKSGRGRKGERDSDATTTADAPATSPALGPEGPAVAAAGPSARAGATRAGGPDGWLVLLAALVPAAALAGAARFRRPAPDRG